ncbi:hypothetical protein [Aliiroseovarius sp. F20344]|uniref:hypothetical protein n=1 Tax=Aliiroseovarius sp. F20344 TaxID=2926414 RepID=UPI001FF13668|nr:hypothetical protein [Aliiroseovarius sp. F20344]MCK0141501.1 hypothetical protein [Aliiroseovarius sp. F20344]
MEQSDILSRLTDIVDNTVARGDQSIHLNHTSTEARCLAAIEIVHATILPRMIQISNDEEDAVTLSVNNGRVASMSDTAMDGVQSNTPETTAEHVAQILAMICSGTGLKLHSTPPDNTDEVAATGIPTSEIEGAFDVMELFHDEAAPDADTALDKPAVLNEACGLAASFHSEAKKITDQRILIGHDDTAVAGPDGVLTQNLDAVGQLMDDLATWDAENGGQEASPQLVILRSCREETPSLTICRDIDATAMVVHHTRRLGAVVQMWKSLTAK